MFPSAVEKQITFAPHGHILTNIGVWSPDSQWIVYDTRSDPAGSIFDGTRIERVHVETGEVQLLYESRNGAHCGVVTYSPVDERVAFILGPEHPTPDWQYGPTHRQGVIVETKRPGIAIPIDARNLLPPFTPGALRGGSHVHTFSGDGKWIAFTYEDHVLEQLPNDRERDRNQRNVGVSVPISPVHVKKDHPRNHDGTYFSVLITRTVSHARPGSDEINRAFEDAWVGVDGYVRSDGQRQRRAIAFQGQVVTASGGTISEVFIVDLPEDVTVAVPGEPLEGTAARLPRPPRGTSQRRLTHTEHRKQPGLQGPRHWLRSSPDGSRIAFLMKDDRDVIQLWTISPLGGDPVQVTHNSNDIASAFTWSQDGKWIAHVLDGGIWISELASGRTHQLTPTTNHALPARPEACVVSPDGKKIAYVRPIPVEGRVLNQVFVRFLK